MTPIATVTTLSCAGATHNGTLTSGTAASGVSSVISYTGGNGGTYATQTITSTGVTGLTATLTAGTLASGAGTVTYTITGTPAASGTASFAISLGGQSCTLTRTVALPAATITALDCAGATHNGTLTSGTAASGVSSVISYTGGNGGTYTTQTITSTGVTGLTATLTAGTIASGAGTITYTITGTPVASGTASFAISLGGQSCTLTRTVDISMTPIATVSTLDCAGATHNGTLTSGTAASGVSSVIAYTGGNGGTYAAQTITSTGVTGLTATLTAGTLASGAGTITYTITGTPTASGTASFAISLGGQTCTLTRTVATNIVLECVGATHNGTLTRGIAANSVSTVISYTGGSGESYAEQTITSTGVTGLSATIPAGIFATGSGTFFLTITGTPVTSGTASFTFTLGGQTCTFTRTVAAPQFVLNCTDTTHNGTLTSGTAASGVSSVISYTGGNGVAYIAQAITSTGVTGLTANLVSGTLADNDGTLTLTITGTPATSGTASFAVTINGQSCTVTRTVAEQGAEAEAVFALDCVGATHNGNLASSTAASGVSTVVSYTGGNGSSYTLQTITSTNVTGLTATLTAGTLATGVGSLTFTITGTPDTSGTASFTFTINGQSCTFNRTVILNIPASITLAQGRMHQILSVYDHNYLPYTAPTSAATINKSAPDATSETFIVNVQGTITTTGISVFLPVTVTASGTLPGFSTVVNVPANLTEDGISRDVKLSWPTQSYTAATTRITLTIAALGGTLNVKRLDINEGLGNDGLGVLLGTFSYPFNSTGTTTNFNLRVIPGILDRMFGNTDNFNRNFTHLFIYAPMVAEDGNIWLNNNLGANYANVYSKAFSPLSQSTVEHDVNSWGSLFQWGRRPDGHELIAQYPNPLTKVYEISSTKSDAPTGGFINDSTNWRVNPSSTLWATEASTNNPCPVGYRVPTATEATNLLTAANITSVTTFLNNSVLKLNTGFTWSSGLIFDDTNSILSPISDLTTRQRYLYYTSTATGTTSVTATQFRFSTTTTTSLGVGQPIRCIRN
jgi:hypothetical protein